MALKVRFDFSGRFPESPLNLSLNLWMERRPQCALN